MRVCVILAIFFTGCFAAAAAGQAPATLPATEPASQAASAPASRPAADDMIQLTFPANVEVKVLVDYVSKRLGMNILFDESIGAKRVTISSPAKIPKESLVGLLQSVLKMAGLAMVDGDQPGWKKIVQGQNLLAATTRMNRDVAELDNAQAGAALTQIFQLASSSTGSIEPALRPLLSQPGGNIFPVPDKGLLIITDYAGNLRRVASLIEILDKPGAKADIQFVPVKNLDATELSHQVTSLLADKDRLIGRTANKVTLTVEPRTNQIVLISTQGADEEARKLIETLDVPTSAVTKTYRVKHIAPQRIDKLAQDFVGTDTFAKRLYKSTLDAESGILIVSAPQTVHTYIGSILQDLDVPGEPTTSNIRFYKLMNATASAVLATIRSLDSSDRGLAGLDMGTQPPVGPPDHFTGPNNPPPAVGANLPTPPAYHATTSPASQPSAEYGTSVLTARTKDATLTADPNTNTIIIIAPPAVQDSYRQLIALLDKRRPQVMVEVTLVTLDTSDSCSLGVELARKESLGSTGQSLVFSSFGLSSIDPATGVQKIIPGTGFNGIVIDPDTINVVVKALASSAKAKVLSAPKVLVNDNASATLSSIAEAPFTSINASQTVSTTSFAGYASAGTTVTVTPHISEGDHLNLQYTVTLNSFTGTGSESVPPPRQTNTVNSDITIPDGYAVIVGGLNRKDTSDTAAKVPILGDIPVIKYLFSSGTKKASQSTLFVFIRPVILRDDLFEDLKYLSEKDLQKAQLPSNLPCSEPVFVE